MAPKRKRVEDSAAAPAASGSRSTRSSTRNQAKNDAPAPAAQASETAGSNSTEPVTKRKKIAKEPAAPKEKKAPVKKAPKKMDARPVDDDSTATSAKAAGASNAVTSVNATLPSSATTKPQAPQANGQTPQPQSNGVAASSAPVPVPIQQTSVRPPTPPPVPATPQPANPPASLKVQPYTPQRCLALFAKYAEGEDANVIGPEGFESLCMETGIPLEGALPLILAWQVNAQEMAKITKDEWVKGMGALKVASLPALAAALNDLQNLLIMRQGAVKKLTGKKEDVYDKTLYLSYAQDPKAAFGKLYSYCFSLAKQEGSRNIDMETASAFWSVLLVPQYPIMADVLEFLTEKGTYKAANKDLWSMMLEFCETVEPSLQDYESDGAWPTLLDDFASWRKSKTANPNGNENGVE